MNRYVSLGFYRYLIVSEQVGCYIVERPDGSKKPQQANQDISHQTVKARELPDMVKRSDVYMCRGTNRYKITGAAFTYVAREFVCVVFESPHKRANFDYLSPDADVTIETPTVESDEVESEWRELIRDWDNDDSPQPAESVAPKRKPRKPYRRGWPMHDMPLWEDLHSISVRVLGEVS